ncbi:MAG: RNA-binding cell elongation regulator Jag/EloR [Desulfobacterales bacterium]
MAHTMELEAKNVEQAVKLACDKLEIPPDQLQYDILSHGSSGLFGLVKTRKAKIRVMIDQETAETRRTAEFQEAERPLSDAEDHKNSGHREIEDLSRPRDSQTAPPSAEPCAAGQEALQRIVDTISSGAIVAVEKTAERVLYTVNGGNSAILIGKHGQTLEAMQTLVEIIVNMKKASRARVEVDIGGYLAGREKALIRQAESLAQKCKHSRRPVTVGYMNAHDRRIVHLALKDDADVRTRSTGDGLRRKLVIYPNQTSSPKGGHRQQL